ncbi:zinc finger BED domain-containing protein 4-like [Bacillus rossius redtenbacheri]|uniref:zinc finger BED domain-containing protein 4-like n=1 Tax=Bacillus rossius redtenbacheri TaxID=93214 RepID=UPI002FDD6D4C
MADSSGNVQDRKLSHIWKFYEKRKGEGECKVCKKRIQTPTGSTSGLLRHLKLHPAAEKNYLDLTKEKATKQKENSYRQLSIQDCVTKKQKVSEARKTIIDRKIGAMMACDFQPYSIVEDRGFKGLLNELEPGYEVPSRTTFSRSIVPKIYREEKAKLAEEIKTDVDDGLQSVSFTTDMWSSARQDSFISLTSHYLTKDFELKYHVLGNYHFSGSHTALAIQEKLTAAIEEWNFPTNSIPLYVVTDNAKNFTAAINKTSWIHTRCFAHTLQLAVQDAKSEHNVADLLAKGRAIVGHYRHSNIARERLHALQLKLSKPVHELLPMVPTRWNSEFTMLSRLVEQQVPLSADLGDSMAVENFTLSEWKLAANVVSVLQPIEQATRELCYSKFPTISSKIPLLYGIEATLSNYVEEQSNPGIAFAISLQKSIKSRFPLYTTVKEDMIAMVLDPRFKNILLQDHENLICVQRITSDLKVVVDKKTASVPEENPSDTVEASCSLWNTFEHLKKSSCSSVKSPRVENELTIYLGENVIPRSSDPLMWWQQNQSRFPALARVARKYLAIPATQVESERLFRSAGNTVTSRRENLLAENIEQLVFLNSRF